MYVIIATNDLYMLQKCLSSAYMHWINISVIQILKRKFPIFRFWAYSMKIIPETRRAH